LSSLSARVVERSEIATKKKKKLGEGKKNKNAPLEVRNIVSVFGESTLKKIFFSKKM